MPARRPGRSSRAQWEVERAVLWGRKPHLPLTLHRSLHFLGSSLGLRQAGCAQPQGGNGCPAWDRAVWETGQ